MKLTKIILLIALFFSPIQAKQSNILRKGSIKKAIVIGASSGIGKAIAKELAQHHYLVGITARRLDLLLELKKEFPKNIYVQQMDVLEPEQAQNQFFDLIDKLGGLDLVVINAGIWPDIDPKLLPSGGSISWTNEKDTINVNVTGFTAIANVAMNYFIQQRFCHLVGISSVDAVRGSASGPAYCASKAFVSTYMEGMRNKCIQLGIPIDITDVRPGYVATYEIPPDAYWVATPKEAAKQIYEAIVDKKKVAYVTKRWQLIAWLLQIVPDYIYNKMGGF